MSVANTNKLRARVATLDRLLDDFDGLLDDLLAESLPETLLKLETLQQAKLQVTIPYLVYDLVIIYLKTKGIDPRTHPVFRELDRVRGYIEKVSKAEKQESEQQRTTIDKAAANRFIKHAISQAVRSQGQSSTEPPAVDQPPTPGPSSGAPARPTPAGATNKMLARVEWEKQVRAAAEEEEDLEVFEETEGNANADADVEMTEDKAPPPTPLPIEAGETTLSEQQSVTTKKKKKRNKNSKLPLTGAAFPPVTMGTNAEGTGSTTEPAPLPPQLETRTDTGDTAPQNPGSKTNAKKRPLPPSEPPTGDSEGPASASAPKNKKRKRNKKKQNTPGGETDGTPSQSRSQSRDVSVASTPQVPTQPLPGVEADGMTGAGEKPKKWRKYNRKKKNANGQPTAETGAQS